MKLGFKAETTGHSSAISKKLRFAISASMVVLALAVAPLAVAQTQTPPPAAGGSSLPTAAEATSIITQSVGGNAQAANQIIQALGGDPVTALNAFTNGNASSSLGSALGGTNAVNMLTQAMGTGNALSALTGALGQNGSINALVGAMGGNNAIGSLAGSLLGNSSAISSLQAALGGNTQGLQALSSFLGGNTGALSTLTSALGGTNGALSALTGALGANGALSALSGALGADGALSALTNALGASGALNALTGALGGQITELLGGLGLSTVCGTAALTGTFAVPACEQTADSRSIEYVQEEPGGKEIAKKIEETHTDRLLPAMKDRTAQLSAGVSDQSRQLGSIVDAAQMGDAQRDIEREELDTRQGLQQHEQSCALPTSGPALAQTHRAGAALARALVEDFTKRNNPVPGTTAARGYGAVIAERYETYCKYFVDPEDNNGVNACTQAMQEAAAAEEAPAGATPADGATPSTPTSPAPATPAPADADASDSGDGEQTIGLAARPNADIDVEQLLFKDTIDIDDTPTRAAVEALLDNLVQSRPYPMLTPEELNSAAGTEWTVRKERLETLRKIAADVVAGMVSRRIGIPLPQTVSEGTPMNPMEGGPSGQCNVPAEAGDANTKAVAYANYWRNRSVQIGRFNRNPPGKRGGTLCQRLSYEASGGVMSGSEAAHRAVFGNAPSRATPSPTRSGGSAPAALAAWYHFRRTGVAQSDMSQIKPGDLVYMVKHNRAAAAERSYMAGNCQTYRDGCEAGHTGVYMGGGEMCHVFKQNYTPILCDALSNRNNTYKILGFVRPSGVNADVADCEFDYNEGTQPGQPTTITSGPRVGQQTGAAPDPTPPSRETPTEATPVTPPEGSRSRGGYDAYKTALGFRESGQEGSANGLCNNGGRVNYSGQTRGGYRCVNNLGYMGKYQFGQIALIDVGCKDRSGRWKACFGSTMRRGSADFLENPSVQEGAINRLNDNQWRYIETAKNSVCQRMGGLLLTHSGMIAGSHLVGHTAVKAFVRSNGREVRRDGNGTRITEYMHLLGGYTVPFGVGNYRSGNCPGDMVAAFGPGTAPSGDSTDSDGMTYGDYYTPPPPRPVKDIIREIRQRAGVPASEIGQDPSYNEIMLAMTKERFFDPSFFAQITDSVPAMQNNELALNAYIAMTLQDIEMLQEQINALVAARASLRIEELERKNGK